MKPVVIVLTFLLSSVQHSAQWEKIFEVQNYNQNVKIFTVCYDENLGIFAGADYMGLYHSSDSGETWDYKGFESIFTFVKQIIKDNSNRILIRTNQIYASVDTGDTWEPLSIVNPSSGYNENVLKFIYDSSTGKIYAGGEVGRLFSSDNHGNNWTLLNTFDLGCWCNNIKIEAISVSPNQEIFVGANVICGDWGGTCDDFNLFKSITDTSWNAVLQANIKSVYSINDSIILAASNSQLYRSTSSGISWSNELFNIPINVITASDFGEIYLGTNDGIYFSNDLGVNWEHIENTGFTNPIVLDIDFGNDSTIYAAAWDGLYKYPGTVTSIVNSAYSSDMTFALNQNYPNPFNPETKIVYSIPNTAFVNIAVFDVLGKQITTLVNEEKSTGTYKIKWSAEDFPSGIYFYRLQSEEFLKVKKMLLIK